MLWGRPWRRRPGRAWWLGPPLARSEVVGLRRHASGGGLGGCRWGGEGGVVGAGQPEDHDGGGDRDEHAERREDGPGSDPGRGVTRVMVCGVDMVCSVVVGR